MMISLVFYLLTNLFCGLIFETRYMIYLLIFNTVVFMGLVMITFSESYFIGEMGLFCDSMSSSLVMLSIWVSLLMIFSSHKIYFMNENGKLFLFLISLLMAVLMVTFYLSDYLMFYFFFEISLIPTLLIIMGWGYQPERLQAGIYFIFYTLTASLPLLLGIIYFYNTSLDLKIWTDLSFSLLGLTNFKFLVGIAMFGAFLVKLPMFFTHLWLPKAHVEAPVAGSMILAGVLLKLGGYGIMRLYKLVFSFYSLYSSYLIGLSLLGMVYVGFMCCRLNDFKALVAYSSVAHMGMVICGCLNLFSWGFEGSLAMMIGHGVSSSGLFCMVNMYYERLGSRSFYINKGLLLIFPIFGMMIFLLSAANIAAPPTVNLMSEIFLMGSILKFDLLMVMVFPLGSFLGAVFTIFMFSYSQHGKIYFTSYGVGSSSFREMMVLTLHIIPLNFLVLNSSLFLVI